MGVPFLNHDKRKGTSDLVVTFQSPVNNMIILKWSYFVIYMLFSDKYVSVYHTVNMTDQNMQPLQREQFVC